MAHRSLTVLVAAVVMAPLVLLTSPAHAVAPRPANEINQMTATSSALDGRQVPSDGATQVTASPGYGGRPMPTLQEVTLWENADACEGLGCRKPAGARWGRYWVDFRLAQVDRPAIPTVASFGLTNLRPGSRLGVQVRLFNGEWSNAYTVTLPVAAAVDPRDTLPVNTRLPELGSSSNGRLPVPALANDSWLKMLSVGRWAPGAVTSAYAVRVQTQECLNAACTIDWVEPHPWLISTCIFEGARGPLLINSDQPCGLQPLRYLDPTRPGCWRGRVSARNAVGWSAWVETLPKCVPGRTPGDLAPGANPAAEPAAEPAANPAANPSDNAASGSAALSGVAAALAAAPGFDSAATPVVADGSVSAAGLSLSVTVAKKVKRGKKFAVTLTVLPKAMRGGMRQYLISMTGDQPRLQRSSRGFISSGSRTKRYWLSRQAPRGSYVVLSTFTPSTPGITGLSVVTPITVK